MIRQVLIALFACMMAAASPALAEIGEADSEAEAITSDSVLLNRASQLIAAGRLNEALELLSSSGFRTVAGARRRDWMMASIYRRTGNLALARARLARLVAAYPDNMLYRETYRAVGGRPPDARAEKAGSSSSLQFSGGLSFNLVTSSNPNARTTDLIYIGGLPFRPAAIRQETGIEIGAEGRVSYSLSPTTQVIGKLRGAGKWFPRGVPSDMSISAEVGLDARPDRSSRFNFAFGHTYREIAGNSYSHTPYARLGYDRLLTPSRLISTGLRVSWRDYTASRAADGRDVLVSLGLTQQISPKVLLMLSGEYERVSARRSDLSSSEWRLSATGRFNLTDALRMGLTLSHAATRFDGIHPLFGVLRHDSKNTIELTVENDRLKIRGMVPRIGVAYERRHSNLAAYKYENTSLRFGFSRRF